MEGPVRFWWGDAQQEGRGIYAICSGAGKLVEGGTLIELTLDVDGMDIKTYIPLRRGMGNVATLLRVTTQWPVYRPLEEYGLPVAVDVFGMRVGCGIRKAAIAAWQRDPDSHAYH